MSCLKANRRSMWPASMLLRPPILENPPCDLLAHDIGFRFYLLSTCLSRSLVASCRLLCLYLSKTFDLNSFTDRFSLRAVRPHLFAFSRNNYVSADIYLLSRKDLAHHEQVGPDWSRLRLRATESQLSASLTAWRIWTSRAGDKHSSRSD